MRRSWKQRWVKYWIRIQAIYLEWVRLPLQMQFPLTVVLTLKTKIAYQAKVRSQSKVQEDHTTNWNVDWRILNHPLISRDLMISMSQKQPNELWSLLRTRQSGRKLSWMTCTVRLLVAAFPKCNEWRSKTINLPLPRLSSNHQRLVKAKTTQAETTLERLWISMLILMQVSQR